MKYVALVTAGCFLVLSAFSIGKYHPDAKPQTRPAEYTAADRRAMNDLVASTLHASADPVVLTKDGFVVYDSGTRAELIAELLNITPQSIDAHERWFK